MNKNGLERTNDLLEELILELNKVNNRLDKLERVDDKVLDSIKNIYQYLQSNDFKSIVSGA